MPYINKDRRTSLQSGSIPSDGVISPGDLNYMFTCLINKYVAHRGTNYQAINDVVGALEGAKLEFYRRVAAPYEDQKILENGDVY
jgi:hypothetical protein